MTETLTPYTFKGAAFWDGTHALSELQETLSVTLVPNHGDAATPHGQLLRYMSHLYYDVYNNGYCNSYSLDLARSFVTDLKPTLLSFLENQASWEKSLDTILRAVGGCDETLCPEALLLEDITTAVVKYVAQQEGIELPKVELPNVELAKG